VLMVTHDVQLVDPAFDRVFAIGGGRIVAEGAPPEVLTSERLAAIFDDPHVRATRLNGRTVVWSE